MCMDCTKKETATLSCEIHPAVECNERSVKGDFAAACDGQVGWHDGKHPQCCGNCWA